MNIRASRPNHPAQAGIKETTLTRNQQSPIVQETMQDLRDIIRRHDHQYYTLDKPDITDREYDRLYDQLLKLEYDHPELLDPHSPTQRVGGTVSAGFAAVTHDQPMLSLANAFTGTDFMDWHARCVRALPKSPITMTAELKFDGLALNLEYQDGRLARAATRGNGTTGENVTHTARTIRNLPLVLRGQGAGATTVRGEAYMPIAAFNTLNEQRLEDGEDAYANPRNAAAGAIRQLDPSRAARRDLRFWAYALEHADTGIRESQWDNLDHMGEMGLPVHKRRIRSQTPAEIVEYYQQMVEVRSGLPFEADGIVIKIDAHRYQQQLGTTGHDPRWAIAWKFPCVEARTRLNRIFISMGRFGKLTPVAELEPVSLDGATIRHASLHNENDIRRKDIRAGDIVVIKRAGGVIPQVTGPADTNPGRSTTRFSMPQHCPECREPVRQSPDDAAHWCDNDNCGSKPIEALKHFVSKDSFDIDGLGPVICNAMITSGLVTNPGEVFHLTAEQIESLDRMGPKLAERIHDSIQGAKSRPLHRVLYALGIYRLGHHVSAQLARRYDSLEEARRLSREDLMRLDGINEKIADSVLAGFAKRRTIETIKGMRDAGVVLEKTERAEPAAPNSTPLFEGTRICVTGTLNDMTRDEAQEHIRTLRGTAVSTVTKKTNVLVVGAKPGSKVAKARQTNTIIWDEEQFRAKLAEAGLSV